MAQPAAVLNILVTANTAQATTGLRKVEAQSVATHKGFLGLGKSSGALSSHLSGMAKAALGAGAALVAIHEGKKAVESTEALAKSTIELQRNFGLSAKEASTWGAVLKTNNVDINSAKMSFTSLSKAIVGAGNDSKPAVAAFKAIGISQRDLKGLNFDQVLNEVTDALTKMKGGTDRAQAAQALLGRGAKVLAPLFRGDGLGFRQQAKWAAEYGATLDGHAIRSSKDLAIASEKLKYAQLGLQIQFTEKVIPAIVKVAGALSGVVKFFERNKNATLALKLGLVAATAAWVAMGIAAAVATGGLTLIIPALAALAAGFVYAYKKSEAFRSVVRVVFNTVLKIIQTYVTIILTVLDKFLGGIQLLMDAASHLPFVGKKFKGIADAIGGAREKVRELRDAVQNINGLHADVKVNVTANLVDVQQHTATMKALGNRRAMGGLVVGGSGSGDKVPLQAMVEPGEQLFVLNRNASAALDFLQGVNAAVPRFAGGGSLKLGPGVGGRLRRHVTAMAGRAEGKWVQAHPSLPSLGGSLAGPSGPVPPGSARDWLIQALKITGQYTRSNLSALYLQMMSESGGNPHAINLWDSNAKAGHPSKGLLQTIDSTFNRYRIPGLGNIWDPIANTVAAIRYMLATYGHIVGTGHGYQRGGIVGLKRGGVGRLTHHATPFSHHYISPVTGHGFGAGRHVLNWKKKHGKAGGPGKAIDLFQSVQDQLDLLDLMQQAGEISQAEAVARETAQIDYALAHPKAYGLSFNEQLQLKATRAGLTSGAGGGDPNQPLIDSNDALAAAQQVLADQLKGVQDEMKRNNDINEGTLAITAREATRAMTDVLAGQLGYRVSQAGFSPGFGVGARYSLNGS